jgi:TetR/AcrR family transcriptional repressor of nem operon
VRNSRKAKAANHARIVDIAAARIRGAGTDGLGVAKVMESAGLTHGGFYKHFGSLDDLVCEAFEEALADGERQVVATISGGGDPLEAFVDAYASASHVEHPEQGCGVVALGSDAARAGPRVRDAYTAQVARYLGHLELLIGGEDARRRAEQALAILVGAVLLARAVNDQALSVQVLQTARDSVLALRQSGARG